MIKLLLFCGAMLLLTGTMIVLNIRRIARGKKNRRKDVLLLVLWGIVFTVFAMPFLMIAATPHKDEIHEKPLYYAVTNTDGIMHYRYWGGKILDAPPGVLCDFTTDRPDIYRSDDPTFPYYAAYKGKYYPLQLDFIEPFEYPEKNSGKTTGVFCLCRSPKPMGSRGVTLPLRGAGAAPLLGFRGKAPKRP